MNLLTILLQAEGAASPQGGGMRLMIMMILVFGVMYFFMIRPQQKRQKEMVKFRETLQKGDKVVTAGGIFGTIKEVKDNYILLDVDTNTTIRVDKSMIMRAPEAAAQAKK